MIINNMESFSLEKTVTEYITEKYRLNKNFYLEVKRVDGRITQQKINSFKKIPNSSFEYVIDLDAFREECKKNYFYSEDSKKNYWWRSHIVDDLFDEFQKNGFNEERIVNIRGYDHSILDRNGVYFDILLEFDYTRSQIRQRVEDSESPRYNWKELKKHLQEHPQVFNLKEVEIPWFNCDYDGQKALEMDVLMLGAWRPKDNGNMPYQSKEDLIHGNCDPLKIKQFIIK